MPNTDIEDAYILTPTQEGMLFHSVSAPQSGVYIDQLVFSLQGDLHVAAFQRAWNGIMARHPGLRTSFHWQEAEKPLQVVHTQVEWPLSIVDWTGRPAENVEAALHDFLQADRAAGFDLSTPPLTRLTLVLLAEDVAELIWTYHHILLDAWSIFVLLRELFILYEAEVSNLPPILSLVYPFRHYIHWLQQQDLSAAEHYWRRELRGFTSPTPLGIDRSDTPGDMAEPLVYEDRLSTLSSRDSRAVQACLRRHQLTLNTLAQAAFAMLLHRYSGAADILFGLVMAGRPPEVPHVDSIVGAFVTSLPVRLRLPGHHTLLLDWLQSIQAHQAELSRFEYSPLPEVKRWSDVPSETPLFESLLSVETIPGSDLPMQQAHRLGLELRNFRYRLKTNYPLNVLVIPGDNLTLRLTYDPQRFQAAAIEQMLQHLHVLLCQMVARPEQPIRELSLLTPEERQHVLTLGRRTPQAYPASVCLPDLFDAQAMRHPDRIALVYEDQCVSYGALQQQADVLANRLRACGVGVEAPVGICLDRSPAMITSILAVLKAGAAYLPLDPASPTERLAFMLADAAVRVVITQQNLRPVLPSLPVDVIDIDDRNTVVAPLTTQEPVHLSAANMAYVMYTSGSTGTPKGVAVTHANVVRLLAATDDCYGFTAQDVWTLFHSYAFDFSVWEMWGALAYGGKLLIIPYAVSRSPRDFLEVLSREGVTVLNQTPTAFRELLKEEAATELPLRLRYVIFGGEALDLQALHSWFAHHGESRPCLVNMYGITETTVHVTYRALTAADADATTGSVIGAPLDDLQLYLLDTWQQPVPVGVVGEIYVGGAGLARGYLGQPALTAERFVPHPFDPAGGARLYRTGDLARWGADGDLVYRGRIDDQVKVRGFRIELGEIEAALRRQPDVQDAIVLARTSAEGAQLVAYVVSAAPLGDTAIRLALAQSLPDYMIPAHVVWLSHLPLTPNGKLDRRALLALETRETTPEAAYTPPRNAREQRLADAWTTVLGVDRVGIDDSYIALGGDSIRALPLVARSREDGVPCTVADLFRVQTIRGLVALVDGQDTVADVAASTSAPFRLLSPQDRQRLPKDVEDAYPLSTLQQGMFFHSEIAPDSAIFHDIFLYHMRLPWHEAHFREALEDTVARHAVLRTSFHWSGYGEPLQMVHHAVSIPYRLYDQRGLSAAQQEAAVATWMDEEKRQPFDKEQAPLMRVSVHWRAETEVQLGFSFHHAILDGWSFANLMTQLMTRYLALLGLQTRGEWPAVSSTIGDFIALERQAIQSEDSQQFWSERLTDLHVSTLPRLPLGAGNPSARTGRFYDTLLPPELTDALHDLARATQVPLKSVLLAAHLRVLAWLSGSTDVVTGLVSNGRPETADSIYALGLFLNTVPFRLRLPSGTWTDLIWETFHAEHEVLLHRLFPLTEIKRLTGRSVLYDTGFNFIHYHIYDDLWHCDDIDILGLELFEETDFPFTANFFIAPPESGLSLRLNYDDTTFSAEQIETTAGYYVRTLQAMVRDPQAAYRHVPMLAPEEHQQILVTWNAPHLPRAEVRPVVAQFEERVRAQPDAIAVVGDDTAITYQALNAQANRLAHTLIGPYGVQPEQLVGLLVQRSVHMVAGLLGILKAGAACLPLDASDPDARLAFMLRDSEVTLLVSDGTRPLPPMSSPLDVVAVHTARHGPHRTDPQVDRHGHHLAYVIYTSGSTGQPKGVLIEQEALARHCQACQATYALGPENRVLQFAPLAFDVAFEQIVPSLLAGARLYLRGQEVWSPQQLLHVMRQEHLSVVNVPTAYWQQSVGIWADQDAGVTEALPRLMIVGGEAMGLPAARLWLDRLAGPCTLLNAYGPTEATITATHELVTSVSDAAWTGPSVPIGRAGSGRTAYILDEDGHALPVGVIGELCLGGVGVAHGYLHQPGLTAARFVPDPYGPEAGARLYRTGDRGRWLARGSIALHGRDDMQVKVRGFRVELGEIEGALRTLPGVEEALVLARARDDTQELVAYVRGESGLMRGALRAALAQTLPAYMLPSHLVQIERFPLTRNGKIDRSALPEVAEAAQVRSTTYIAPRTPIEIALARIWQEVLSLKSVGVEDNFFELGGDSILSLQVSAKSAQADLTLTPQDIFHYPTIAQLALMAETPPLQGDQGVFVGEVALTPIQTWFFAQAPPQPQHYNQAVLLEIDATMQAELLEAALRGVLRHHDALRMRFRREGGQWRAWIVAPDDDVLSFTCIDLSAPSAPRFEDVAAQLQTGLDLERGPLVRAAYLRGGADEPVTLLIVIHHLVVDGVSWRILLADMYQAYGYLAQGETTVLPSKTASYPTWSAALRRYAEGTEWHRELAYWLEVGSHQVTPLPQDREASREMNTAAVAEHVSVRLEASRTTALLREVPGVYHTRIDEVLLTALALTLYHWTGGRQHRVDLESHGRHALVEGLDVSRTVGWFTAIYPFWLDLATPDDLGVALRQVKDQLRAVPHHGMGYGLLRYLIPQDEATEQLGTLPRAEISFNYLGQIDTTQASAWTLASEGVGPLYSPTWPRPYLLEINAVVLDAELHVDWSYSRCHHDRVTIEELAADYLSCLQALIIHCQHPASGGYSPSDFSALGLGQEDLDTLLRHIRNVDSGC